MAEIKVEKKTSPVWPWILGVLLLAAIIWIVADDNDMDTEKIERTVQVEDEADQYETTPEQREAATEEGAAMAFVSFVEENRKNITKKHEYSHEALTRLSKALNSVSKDADQQTRQELDQLKEQADRLMKNTSSEQHANVMRDAFTTAANAMQNMQKQNYPDLQNEVQEVMEAAKNIKPNELATNQKDAIKNFFDESAEVVEAMAQKENV